MATHWIEPTDISVSDELGESVGGHPLVAKILARRGIRSVQAARAFLNPDEYIPASPYELPDMEAAVERIDTALQRGEKICVWGDFDVDGQTATTLLVSAIRELGGQSIYHIPVRSRESHGVNLRVLSQLLEEDPEVGVLLTCDTGIAAHEAVDYAQQKGVDVVITDHHKLPEVLPKARAIVNPNRLSKDHALHSLPGVGVAFKLIEAMYEKYGHVDKLASYLDLVALGIVADVAELADDTRYLLQLGLSELRESKRPGLRLMMQIAGLQPEWITEEHIGYVLGPRLNALGRLDDANQVVELFTTQEEGRARTLVHHLEGLNSRRQLLTSQVFRGALAQLQNDPGLLDYSALVLSHEDWPAGIIGIVASRLVERYHKPVILIATPAGSLGRASARSVEGVDITSLISSHAELLEGYGGHKMAAGFAIQTDRIREFRRRISQSIDTLGAPLEKELFIDAYLSLSELNLGLVMDLERLAPYGPGNPAPVFASRDLGLVSHRRVGRTGNHLLVMVEDQEQIQQRVIWWGGADELEIRGLPDGRFDLAYIARASTFRGQREVEVEWLEIRIRDDLPRDLVTEGRRIVVDYRGVPHGMALLTELKETHQIWAEGAAYLKLRQAGFHPRTRNQLQPEQDLIVWNSPPDRTTWENVLQRVDPQRVVLFSHASKMDRIGQFLERLIGTVKYSLNQKDGEIQIEDMAAGLGHTSQTILIGLEFLAVQGQITVLEIAKGTLKIGYGGEEAKESGNDRALEQLRASLEETRAFRAFFTRADKWILFN